jgi:hypothetical protein
VGAIGRVGLVGRIPFHRHPADEVDVELIF